MEIIEIPVEKLKVDAFNVRGSEWDQNEELIESVKQQGVLEPLIIRKTNDETNPYGIVCGNRRWHAAIDAGLRAVPCIVKEMTDFQALGISLQENLQRNSLDRVQEAEAVAKMWEMLNGDRNYEQKMQEMHKYFGLSQRSVEKYLSLSRFSESFKEKWIKSTVAGDGKKLDIDSAAGISAQDSWSDSEKEEAAEILSRIDSAEQRRKTLSQMKSYKDASPKEAYERIRHVTEDRYYPYYLPGSMIGVFDQACSEKRISWREIITEAVREWLERRGYALPQNM